MATVQTRYGRLIGTGAADCDPTGPHEFECPLAFPVDLLLLLGAKSAEDTRRAHDGIWQSFAFAGLLGPAEKPGEDLPTYIKRTLETFKRRVAQWQREEIPRLFLKAARRASEGQTTPEIAQHLARVRFRSNGAEVGDFLALAAYCLDQAMRDRGFEVRNCALCGHPFLSSGRARYCQRIAPLSKLQEERYGLLELDPLLLAENFDQLSAVSRPSCQDVGKVKDYRERKRAEKGGKTRGK